jgi:hypothetical protein
MTQSNKPDPRIEQKLRDVLEGQTLVLAGSSFAIVAKRHRHRLVHLDLEADDGSHATLIGVPRAHFRLHHPPTPQ